MLRSVCYSGPMRSGLSCTTTSQLQRPQLQRSSAVPVFCKKKKSQGQRGKAPGKRKKQQFNAGAFKPELKPTPAEARALRLEMAAASLQRVAGLKAVIELDRPQNSSNPVLAALLAKTESATATMQAALDADPDSLSDREINAVPSFEVSAYLATGLASVMNATCARSRISSAWSAFEELEQLGWELDGAWDMYKLAPVVARLLCSAVPGFKMFLWLPAGLPDDYPLDIDPSATARSYADAAMQLEERLLNEPGLLAKALYNPIKGASHWENFLPPEGDLFTGLKFASGTCVARQLSMQNGSSIYLMTADEAAPSIHREVSGGSEPWAVMPCNPFAVGVAAILLTDFSFTLAMMDINELMVDKPYSVSPNYGLLGRGKEEEDEEEEWGWEEEEEGDEGEEEGEEERAIIRPCGMLVMF